MKMELNVGWNIIEGENGEASILRWGIIMGWQADRTYRIDSETADLIRNKTTAKVPVMFKKMVPVTSKKMVPVTVKNDQGEEVTTEQEQDVTTEQEQEVQDTVVNADGVEVPRESDEIIMTIEKALKIEKDKIKKEQEEAEAKRKQEAEEDAKKAKIVKK